MQAVLKDPDSDALRFAFASACDAADELERAECVRFQMEAVRAARANENWSKPASDAQSLLDRNGHEVMWSGGIADRVPWYEYHRGFVEKVKLDATEFLAIGAELYQLAPIRRLDLTHAAGVIGELAQSPLLDRIVTLAVDYQEIGDAGVKALAMSPHLRKLQRLYLGGNNVTRVGLEALMRSENLPALKHVNLYGNPVYGAEIDAEYGDDQGQAVMLFDGLWPIEKNLGIRKTWLHTAHDLGRAYENEWVY